MLLRVCCITCTRPHTRPQVDERDDAFVAAELWNTGNGWCRILRHGLEKFMYSSNFPSRVADVEPGREGVRGYDIRVPRVARSRVFEGCRWGGRDGGG